MAYFREMKKKAMDSGLLVFIVDDDETLGATAKCNLVIAVIPPIQHAWCIFGDVMEGDHVGDVAPTMFTVPT